MVSHLDTIQTLTKENKDGKNFIEQRRVFRTTDTTFLISQLFMETYPDAEKARKVWEDKRKPQYEKAKLAASNKKIAKQQYLPDLDLEFSFPRLDGWAHNLIAIRPYNEEHIVAEVIKCLEAGYKKASEYYREDAPCNVLILVPFKNGANQNCAYDWGKIARVACKNLGLRYIDYSDESQRRIPPSPDEVRISTFHSSRGIEGLHSIILGFDSLIEATSEFSTEDKWKVQNLGYITLSRSVFDTDIIFIENKFERKEVQFLKNIIEIVGR